MSYMYQMSKVMTQVKYVKYLATHIFLIYISNSPKSLPNFNRPLVRTDLSQVMYPCHKSCIHVTSHVPMSHVLHPCYYHVSMSHVTCHVSMAHVMYSFHIPTVRSFHFTCHGNHILSNFQDKVSHMWCDMSWHVTCHVTSHFMCHVTSHFMCNVMSQVMSKPQRVMIIDTSCFSADPCVHYRNGWIYR